MYRQRRQRRWGLNGYTGLGASTDAGPWLGVQDQLFAMGMPVAMQQVAFILDTNQQCFYDANRGVKYSTPPKGCEARWKELFEHVREVDRSSEYINRYLKAYGKLEAWLLEREPFLPPERWPGTVSSTATTAKATSSGSTTAVVVGGGLLALATWWALNQ